MYYPWIHLLCALSCRQSEKCSIVPGVSYRFIRNDLSLESGKTSVTGVLLILTPLCNTVYKRESRVSQRLLVMAYLLFGEEGISVPQLNKKQHFI